MIIIILLLFANWYLIGMLGFVYWWTKDYELKNETLYLMFGVGIIGIFSWYEGYQIHGKPTLLTGEKG